MIRTIRYAMLPAMLLLAAGVCAQDGDVEPRPLREDDEPAPAPLEPVPLESLAPETAPAERNEPQAVEPESAESETPAPDGDPSPEPRPDRPPDAPDEAPPAEAAEATTPPTAAEPVPATTPVETAPAAATTRSSGAPVAVETRPATAPAIAETAPTETPPTAPREPPEMDRGMIAVTSPTLSRREYLYGEAADYWSRHVAEPGRREAVRAARADAMRRLAERVWETAVTPEQTLRRFARRSGWDDLDASALLPGARATGIRYAEDAPIVEVRVEAPLRTVYASVASRARTAGAGRSTEMDWLEELIVKAPNAMLSASGYGAPPVEHVRDVPPEILRRVRLLREAPPWIAGSVRGVGSAPLEEGGEAAAVAAADPVARRELLAEARSLRLPGGASVADWADAEASHARRLDELVRSAGPSDRGPGEPMEAGRGYVVLEMDLRPLWEAIAASGEMPSTSPAATRPGRR